MSRPRPGLRHALAASIVALLAACGDGGDGFVDAGTDAPDAAPSSGLSTYCADQADALCRGAEACACPAAPPTAECTATQTRACERALAPLVGGVVFGRIDFDDTLGAACVEDWLAYAQTCAPLDARTQPAGCIGAFTDRADLDDDCTRYSTGLLCAGGAGACVTFDSPTPVCVALPTDGAPCAAGRCAAGLACDGTLCAPPGADGAPCGTDDGCAPGLVCGAGETCAAPAGVSGPCRETGDCADGLVCDGKSCATGPATGAACDSIDAASCGAGDVCLPGSGPATCAPRAQVGEACPRFDDCADGLTCDYNTAVPTCRALPQVGDACIAGQCAPGAGCDPDGVCAALPGEGQACLFSSATPCASGFGCDPLSGLCAPGGADGEACVGGVCAPGLVCDFASPARCQPPGGVGAACTGDNGCAAGLHCDFGSNACAKPVADGQACASDAACVPGSGCVFDGNGNVCQVLPTTDGATCDQRCGGGLRCAAPPGACADGVCDFLY